MMNMSHCRFHNTLEALRECEQALSDMNDPERELSPEEAKAFRRLVKMCERIAGDYELTEPAR